MDKLRGENEISAYVRDFRDRSIKRFWLVIAAISLFFMNIWLSVAVATAISAVFWLLELKVSSGNQRILRREIEDYLAEEEFDQAWVCRGTKIGGSTLCTVLLNKKNIRILDLETFFRIPILHLGWITSVSVKDVSDLMVTDIKTRYTDPHQRVKLDSTEVVLNWRSSEEYEEFKDDFESYFNDQGIFRYEKRGIWGTEEEIEEWRRTDIGLENNFRDLSPYRFEEFVAGLFRKKGYQAHTTSKSGDFGIDVIAKKNGERVGIQVKRNKSDNKVGAPVVQKTLGSAFAGRVDRVLIVTTSYFTGPARKQARNAPIGLWDKNKLHREVEKEFISLS